MRSLLGYSVRQIMTLGSAAAGAYAVNSRSPAHCEFKQLSLEIMPKKDAVEVATQLRALSPLPPTFHITCTGATPKETLSTVQALHNAGLPNVAATLAARNNSPDDLDSYFTKLQALCTNVLLVNGETEGELSFANGLAFVKAIARRQMPNSAQIVVPAYPDSSTDTDSANSATIAKIQHLKSRGLFHSVITQSFVSAEEFFACRAAIVNQTGIDAEKVTPGIALFASQKQARAMANQFNMPVHASLVDHDLTQEEFESTQLAVLGAMAQSLEKGGVRTLHVFTLNNVKQTQTFLRQLADAKYFADR